MKKLLIRADDLGYSKGVNYGIFHAVSDGIINNVGIMLNMPDTKHGVNLLKEFDIDLGCHINFSAGNPLTNPSKIPSLVQKDGQFKSSKEYRESKKDIVVLDEAILEVEAQYQEFVTLLKRKPVYMDGHAIPSLTFQKALATVAKKHDIIYVGNQKSFEGPVEINKQKIVLAMESMLPDYDPTRFMEKYIENKEETLNLLIFHPGFLDEEILTNSSLTRARTKEVAMLCSSKIKDSLLLNEVNLLKFSQL